MRASERFHRLMEEYYIRAHEAKKRGEAVGWVTSNFPQEVYEAMELTVLCPENHAIITAIRQEEQPYLRCAETMGFPNDVCSGARINIGHMMSCVENSDLPIPDFLLCCNNICDQAMKWYRYIENRYEVPMFLLDIPFSYDLEIDKEVLEYIKKQISDIVKSLEKITGKKFSEERLFSVMKISNESGRLWNQIHQKLRENPNLFRGTDLFVYMGLMICARGRESTRDALQQLWEELSQRPHREKYRSVSPFYYEGICCWPAMNKLAISFQKNQLNMVAAVYTRQFGKEYQDFDDMIRQYICIPNCVCIEKTEEMRKREIDESHSCGAFMHMSRTCKRWSRNMYELKHRIEENEKIPVVVFDGDQADRQCFSEAQYDTRLQGFRELLNA